MEKGWTTHTSILGLPWWLSWWKNPPMMRESWVQSLGWEDSLEEGMATRSSILACWNPWTDEPGGLQSMGLQRLGQDGVGTCHSVSSVPQSCPTLQLHELYSPWNSPGQNTEVGYLSLLQGIFPTQGLNPGLPHCRWILYQLSHQGSPRILVWVAYPFSNGSSRPENVTRVSCIAHGFFTNWAMRYTYT